MQNGKDDYGVVFSSVTLLPWLSQSLDLNPIENLRAILKQTLNQYDHSQSNIVELWDRIIEIKFYSITSGDCGGL